jgi:glycosyltransferase involved in cell wall biosynthesis
MRIVHVLHEFPYPANSGIRCDMGRRLAAFAQLGHPVFAIGWLAAGEVPVPEDVAAFEALTDERVLLRVGAGTAERLRRVWNLRRHPSYIAARIPPNAEREALIARVRAWRPDLIWLEGAHPSWLALELSRRLGVPLAYRSHNIEFRYVAEQARLAPTLRQTLALRAGTWGLEAAEARLHREAARVFDISVDDMAYWRSRGLDNASWLAPQPDPAILATAAAPDAARDIDLLFMGSLSSPNNIAGLEWYFDAVHPLVGERLGAHRLMIAGRRPPAALAQRVAAAGAELVADPRDAAPLFARARVMMNPILHGSGVNIKTVDMLATGRTVVTTTKGARGLPAEVVAELRTADTPEGFADLVVEAVRAARAEAGGADRAALVQRIFGAQAVADALAEVAA